LEGDIKISRERAGIERSSLNLESRSLDLRDRQLALNQDMINFNKKMLLAHTAIQATQAAVSLTNAAVGIAKAVDDYHNQKSNLDIQTGTIQYQKELTEAILNGHISVEEVSDGKGGTIRTLKGFDDYKMEDGRTLGELKQEIIQKVGSNYWTNSAADRGMQIATNAFENIELGAQRQAAEKVAKDRYDVYKQELTNAIEVGRKTGDFTQLKEIIDSASSWRGADGSKADYLDAIRQAEALNINDTAISKWETGGPAAVKEYLAEQREARKINRVQEGEMYIAAEKARATAVKPEQDRLNKEWEPITAKATPENAEYLKYVLEGQEKQFLACDYEDEYYKFMKRLDAMATGGTGRSGRSEEDLNNYNGAMMEATWRRYVNGEIGIDEAYSEMFRLEYTERTGHKRNEYYKDMLKYKDPLTAQAFDVFDQLCKEYKIDDRTKSDITEVLTRMFTNNEIKSKDRQQFIRDTINKETAKYLQMGRDKKITQSDMEKINKLSYSGQLDAFFAPVGKEGKHEMVVTGAGEMKKNIINYGREKVEDALTGTYMKYIGHEVEKRSDKDETGRVFHIVEDMDGKQHKVIVNPKGKLEDAKTLSSFEKKLEAEKDAAFKKYEEGLPKDFEEKVLTNYRNRLAMYGSRPVNDELYRTLYREALKEQLGYKINTEMGKAYFDRKMKEFK